jgi:hypothetical protein
MYHRIVYVEAKKKVFLYYCILQIPHYVHKYRKKLEHQRKSTIYKISTCGAQPTTKMLKEINNRSIISYTVRCHGSWLGNSHICQPISKTKTYITCGNLINHTELKNYKCEKVDALEGMQSDDSPATYNSLTILISPSVAIQFPFWQNNRVQILCSLFVINVLLLCGSDM